MMNRSIRKIKFYLNQYTMPKDVKPPYRHVCQIGDPVLRAPAEIVKPELIHTNDIQNIIAMMIQTMRIYDSCGLSAPQIGVPLQIFTAEVTEKQVRLCGPTRRKKQNIEAVPLKVFINPKLKIIDHGAIRFEEGCVSTAGFVAEVPRFKEVLITGLNASGETENWHAKDWSARIAQHEMDHLKGILYTEKMDPATLSLVSWNAVNQRRGRVKLSFLPD